MPLAAGTVLVSSNSMDDDIFRDSTILITEYNENGATGFLINRIAERGLNALAEFSNSRPFPLYHGGPVDTGHLFFIHRRPDLIDGGSHIIDDLYVGGDFKQAVKLINQSMLTVADVKIFIGYCGWDGGELEAEIEDGSWVVSDAVNTFLLAGK